MSKKVLIVVGSPTGGGQSTWLAREYRNALEQRGAQVEWLDIGAMNLAHVDSNMISSLFGGQNEIGAKMVKTSDDLVAQLKRADAVIVASPMYNFGVSSQLKAWVDYVCRAGQTFKYTEQGPVGLLNNKKAFVIRASGGVYDNMPAFEHVESYLKAVFLFLGMEFVGAETLQGLAMGEGHVASAKEKAMANLSDNVEKILA